jgi:hypothetical protein
MVRLANVLAVALVVVGCGGTSELTDADVKEMGQDRAGALGVPGHQGSQRDGTHRRPGVCERQVGEDTKGGWATHTDHSLA